ncbi:MAG: right-handed parallel beta-helix repeat-containing protein, partial [Armatimonadetes bacterium]|nr:right-handed parallel beta-helix repeat-containing protein [Armatimonadota bacterium]
GVALDGVGNRASHNLIHDMPHIGISLRGNENVVEYNIVHHVNLEAEDSGGLYWCSRDWTMRGNVIRYNIFHHCGGFGKVNSWQPVRDGKCEYAYPNFTWGIYLDDPTSGTLVYGNILYKVPICGLMNHGGRDNIFENNIIVDCPGIRESALSPNWEEWPRIIQLLREFTAPGSPYLQRYPELANYSDQRPEQMTGVKFLRNIIYWTADGSAWLRRNHGPTTFGGEQNAAIYLLSMTRDDFAVNEWDYNCIYVPDQLKPVVALSLRGEPSKQLTWDEWRGLGKDEHSLMADPQFVDAQNLDFRLRPESPALKLGFKPIPVERIGPYQSELRASWPIKEAPGAADRGDFETRFAVELYDYAPLPASEIVKRDGIPNFLNKAAAHATLKVAYFGGGIHGPQGWRAQVLDWLRRRTGCQVEEIDAGICDCVRGSRFSVFRTDHDVLQHKPDLVLIDLVRGDEAADCLQVRQAVEGIVRKIWRYDPAIDIIFLYSFQAGFEDAYAEGKCPAAVSEHERVAEHYG